jgi:hypothetical protein
MNLKVNDNKIERITSQTINGLNVNVLLESKNVNTSVPETGYMDLVGFDPSQINVQVDLKRNGSISNLVNTNLALLAVEATAMKGAHLWFKGLPVQEKSATKTHIVKRSVFVYLHGHYNIRGEDELIINVTVNRGAFGSGIDANTATIQIEGNESIGVEVQLNKLHIHSITAELNQDKVTLGDNVTDILLHSFEKDWKKGIFRQVSLMSERFDFTANEQQLDLRHWEKYPFEMADILFANTAEGAHPLRFPNSFKIHQKDEIDKASLSFTLNPANVLATQNYVFYWTFETSKEILTKAVETKMKHDEYNSNKIPLSIN